MYIVEQIKSESGDWLTVIKDENDQQIGSPFDNPIDAHSKLQELRKGL